MLSLAGKTALVTGGSRGIGRAVCVLFGHLGARAVLTKEPGGTAIGRALRAVLLDPASRDLTPMAELLLYFADRAQNVAEVVRPGLDEGRVVLCDRYVESSLAYQGCGRGLSRDAILSLAELATGGQRPDLIVLLDLPVEEGLARVGRRGSHDRLESEKRTFHQRVREGYLELMAAEPERWLRLDATAEPETVFARLWEGLEARKLTGGRES